MSETLWNCTAQELLRRASSRDPTPGGGAVAAVVAAFGLGLVQMSLEVTLAAAETVGADRARLDDARARARELQEAAVDGVDRDVAEFDAVMAGYAMPRESDAERTVRRTAIDAATVTATQGPLGLVEAAILAIELVDDIEPLIKPSIVSDAQAGRDLLRGAAMAALRTADINLVALEQRGHQDASLLRRRRDAAHRKITAAAGDA